MGRLAYQSYLSQQTTIKKKKNKFIIAMHPQKQQHTPE